MPAGPARSRTSPRRSPAVPLACLLAVASSQAALAADLPRWQVAAATAGSGIQPPGFPTAVTGFSAEEIDRGGRLSLQLARSGEAATLWVQDPDRTLRPVARLGAGGALGPGRAGDEAGDTFGVIWAEDYSAVAPVQYFVGVAGGSVGLWRHDGSTNLEIARAGSDGLLGPGLGPGFGFIGNTGIGNAALGRMQVLPDNSLALRSRLDSPEGAVSAVLRWAPEAGFEACALEDSADPTLAPGASAGQPDRFTGLSGLAAGPQGELFVSGSVQLLVLSPTRVGIWRVCEGSPSVRALSGDRGAFGPGIDGAPLAEFISFASEAVPLGGEAFLFAARARLDGSSSTSALIDALFLGDGGGNRPVAIRFESGRYGPGIGDLQFSAFDLVAGEAFAALRADVRPAGGGSDRAGLWRLAGEAPPEPLALVGEDGALAPGPGRRWTGFEAARALANGEVLALATTQALVDGVSERALWRFRPGKRPRRLLGPGDAVVYRDAGGVQRTGAAGALEGLPLGSSLRQDYVGDEGWITAEGDVLLRGRLAGSNATMLLQSERPLLDRALLFRDGFEP